jgi:hypothetical protein
MRRCEARAPRRATLASLLLALVLVPAGAPAAPATEGPRAVTLHTMPRTAGMRIRHHGRTYTTDARGRVTLTLNVFRSARPTSGGFLPFAPPKVLTTRLPSGMVARFGGFFKRGRVIGLSLFTRTRLRFVNREGRDLPTARVTAIRLKSRTGVQVTLAAGEVAKLQASRVIAVPDGVRSKAIEYSVEAVDVNGANVVNRAQQRFFPLRTRELTVPLLLYSARFTSRDALFGYASGSAVLLTDPDGATMRIPLRSGHAQTGGLARGEYLVKVDAAGFSFKRPVSLSRDQVVDLAVVSYLDLAVIFGGLATLAIALVLVGRPAIRARFRRRAHTRRSKMPTSSRT